MRYRIPIILGNTVGFPDEYDNVVNGPSDIAHFNIVRDTKPQFHRTEPVLKFLFQLRNGFYTFK